MQNGRGSPRWFALTFCESRTDYRVLVARRKTHTAKSASGTPGGGGGRAYPGLHRNGRARGVGRTPGFTDRPVPGVWGRPRASRTGPCPGCGADPGLHGPAVTRDPGGGAGANQKCPQNDEIAPKMAQNRVLGPSALTGATLSVKDRPAHTHTPPGCRGVGGQFPKKHNKNRAVPHHPGAITPRRCPTPTGAPRASRPARRPTPRAHPGLHPAAAVPHPGLHSEARGMPDLRPLITLDYVLRKGAQSNW